jgi:hypothetical protein
LIQECDINIPGLPCTLTGHIVPTLAVASLIGIRPLCKAGCKVIFDDKKPEVVYKEKVILRGFKDASTDLWMVPIPTKGMQTTPGHVAKGTNYILPQPGPCEGCALHPPTEATKVASKVVNLATFTHSMKSRANKVKFAHQLLCNPKILTLLKAVRKGFLKGCPNLTEKLILKYLNPSPATAKGHMKRPKHGIKSTHPKPPKKIGITKIPVISYPPQVEQMEVPKVLIEEQLRPIHATNLPNLIGDDGDESLQTCFVSAHFPTKNSGIVYHNLTGSFLFMSYDGSICFFILYHYESNTILGTPIAGLGNISIFEAYKKQFENLAAKGFKPNLNVMDNQATKHIKKCLTKNECKVQLVELHNHRVNAAERAIQTFKDAFIAALATTESNFPLQLWDRLTPQVQDTLNMMRASRINPAILAYEALNGPYGWNRYPLAPLGCKAVVYEDRDTRGLWASRGVDAWYLGPLQDHYRCDFYYIPEMRAYRISGSSELFPQHCQLPDMMLHQHLQELTNELNKMAVGVPDTPK